MAKLNINHPILFILCLIVSLLQLTYLRAERTPLYDEVVNIETPSRFLDAKIINGNVSDYNYILEFTLTNRGTAIEAYDFLICADRCTKAYDNLGNEYQVRIKFGNKAMVAGTARNALPNDIPIKIIATVYNIDPSATSLTMLKIHARCYSANCPKDYSGDFIFRNLPLH